MANISFFDKVIHVTFYKWREDSSNKTIKLEAAFTIRSDQPNPGFNLWEAVRPPTYESNEETAEYGLSTRTKALFAYGGKKGIGTTNGGMKPNMRLQLTQLPETVCTQVQLTIENLTLEIDIKQYSAMLIEAGYSYSNGKVNLFAKHFCSIFSCYVESPNPSGRTVFTGVVGNWFINGLRAQPYTVSIEEGSYRLADWISIICSYLGVIPKIELSKECLNYKIPVQSNWGPPGRAQSGYQVIDWLANELMSVTKEWRQSGHPEGGPLIGRNDVVAAFFQDNIFYVCLASTAREEDKKAMAIDLNRITSASFQGAILYINAPWNPKLLPGQLCHINPVYFRGRLVPVNVYTKGSGVVDENNLYRPITIDVTFETATNVNQMRVMAVAAQIETWNPDETGYKAGDKPAFFKTVEGEEMSVTPEEVKAELNGSVRAETEGETAAFYPSEGNPYAVGILRKYTEEADRRLDVANKANDKRGNLDIYIRIDQEAVDAWNKIVEGVTENEDKKSSEAAKSQPLKYKYLELNDPARDSSNQNKAGDGLKIPFVSLNIQRKQFRDETFDKGAYSLLSGAREYMWANGALTKGLISVSKAPVINMDEDAEIPVLTSAFVSVMSFIRPFAALLSCKEAVNDMGDKDPMLYKDIWWGNVYGMVPIVDAWTIDRLRNVYPECSYASKYHSFFVPKINSGSDLKKWLDDCKSYLEDVIAYWEDLSSNDRGVIRPMYDLINDLKTLLLWNNDYPNSPWTGYSADGKKMENW